MNDRCIFRKEIPALPTETEKTMKIVGQCLCQIRNGSIDPNTAAFHINQAVLNKREKEKQ